MTSFEELKASVQSLSPVAATEWRRRVSLIRPLIGPDSLLAKANRKLDKRRYQLEKAIDELDELIAEVEKQGELLHLDGCQLMALAHNPVIDWAVFAKMLLGVECGDTWRQEVADTIADLETIT